MRKHWILAVLCLLPLLGAAQEENAIELKKARIDLSDQASLQRGAKWYMNYCLACHSLSYQRYQRTAEDLGITDFQGEVIKPLVTENLIFTRAKIGDPILSAIDKKDAKVWFGVTPPDLTLIARVRGSDWLYTYLTSFYRDDSRQWGSNNALFPEVAMPNVFAQAQGIQIPAYVTKTIPYNGSTKEVKVIDHLRLVSNGSMTEQEFDAMVTDLVNFMTYVGEPVQLKREQLGWKVIGFLLILLVLAYYLKRAYWKRLH